MEELPPAQALSSGETVRAAEIVIWVPDGRSIATTVNGKPAPSDTGGVEKVVVTVQDIALVEELERPRADFLTMVSQKIRAPLPSVKGAVTTLLDKSVSLNPAEVHQFHRIIGRQADRMWELSATCWT